MLARLELPRVREVEVVSDEEAALALRCGLDVFVASTAKLLLEHCVDIIPKGSQPRRGRLRDVLVELEFHATWALGGIGLGAGKSSPADAAAKAITARTSSSERLGNSRRMCSVVSPCAR